MTTIEQAGLELLRVTHVLRAAKAPVPRELIAWAARRQKLIRQRLSRPAGKK